MQDNASMHTSTVAKIAAAKNVTSGNSITLNIAQIWRSEIIIYSLNWNPTCMEKKLTSDEEMQSVTLVHFDTKISEYFYESIKMLNVLK